MNYSRQILVGSVTISTFLCLALPLTADSQSKDKAAIQSEIQKMDKASNSKDADGYVVFTHPDFINIDKSGRETTHGKEERREKLRRLFARATQVTGRTTVTHIVLSKQGAVVDKSSVFTLVMTGNGQKIDMKGNGTYRDFWVKNAGVWLQRKSHTITETTTVNGQPVP